MQGSPPARSGFDPRTRQTYSVKIGSDSFIVKRSATGVNDMCPRREHNTLILETDVTAVVTH